MRIFKFVVTVHHDHCNNSHPLVTPVILLGLALRIGDCREFQACFYLLISCDFHKNKRTGGATIETPSCLTESRIVTDTTSCKTELTCQLGAVTVHHDISS